MKILLTGVTGQLGHHLQRQLGQQHEIIAPQRTTLDLADTDNIREFVRATQPQLIIHPAAYTAVDKAETDAALAHQINAVAPGILANEAKKLGIGLIHYSTDYVFDGTLRNTDGSLSAYRESDRVNPLNVYGKTKLAGEQAIIASGCEYLIFRTSWVYSLFGKNFLLTMLRLAKERDALRVVNDQWGAPTSAGWLSDATSQIVKQLTSSTDAAHWWKQHTGIYHMTTAGHTSWCGFTEEILRLAQEHGLLERIPGLTGIPSSEYPTPAARPVNSRLDIGLLEQHFGISTPSWQTALARCLSEH
ncbi:dTDP-4-dehydrorhamnose reductase [Undibacterium sp. SXout7W]|uniref:dTDP-4-dehydrorhamnose reductase n=1 Tax=Undibacterium sp. SXout7W TaxID=3413049 RepID=UPI003BF1284B